MFCKIIYKQRYNTYSQKNSKYEIYFTGYFWIKNRFYNTTDGCIKLYEELVNVETDEINHNKVYTIKGNFSVIISTPKMLIAFVDKVRSFPLFYSIDKHKLLLSNSEESIIKNKDAKFLETSLLEFRMSGYTLGNKTLFQDLNQLYAGQLLLLDKTNRQIKIESYYDYPNKNSKLISKDLKLLLDITNEYFERLIESFDDRPVYIPLSGGLDSRFILGKLLNNGYKNIITYTYGIKEIWEVKAAREIAKYLGVKWYFVEFNQKNTKDLYYSDIRKEYYKYSYSATTVPQLPDFYAILQLQKDKLIVKDPIFINGQSGDFITGGHIPAQLYHLKESDNLSVVELLTIIFKKHFSLWLNLLTNSNIEIVSDEIKKLSGLHNIYSVTRREAIETYENMEWRERQSKYVINGQRVYDFFNYEWRLPLWCDEWLEYWSNISFEQKFNQNLYKEYLQATNYMSLFDRNFSKANSYFPMWSKPLIPLFYMMEKLISKNRQYYYAKYLKYFMAYSPFYPPIEYRTLLKNSANHRSHVSYSSQVLIKEIKDYFGK